MIAGGNALGQLTQQGLAQHLLQLGLTDQHHLQQFSFVGFEVGEQAQLLQYAGQQVLRLIHQYHAALACRQVGQQVIANKVEQPLDPGIFGIGELKLVADGGQQIPFGQGGVEDIGDLGLGGQLLQQAAGDGGFAGAHFAGQQHKAAAILQSIVEMSKGFAVALAHIEVLGIGRDGKRVFREAEELCVHEGILL